MISRLDHLVLTVRDIETTCEFYTKVLGMKLSIFADNRKALNFGQQKINLHQAGQEFEPKSKNPTPGSADLCFISDQPLKEIMTQLQNCCVEIEQGPIERTGATQSILSVYIRDPDGNLIEISNKLDR